MISLTDNDIREITDDALKRSGQVNIYRNSEDNQKAIENRLNTIDKVIIKLYSDNATGILTDDMLNKMVSNLSDEATKLKKQLAEIKAKLSIGNDIVDNYDKFFNLTKQYVHIDELTEEIVRTFIEKIEIGKKELPEGYQAAGKNTPYKQQIKIYYRFIGNIQKSNTIRQNEPELPNKLAV